MVSYTNPKDVLSDKVLKILGDATGLRDRDAWLGIFFLLSKSEHDNERVDSTFESDNHKSVFFYAKRLPYDGEQRGVTVGLAGWTTANDGNDKYGDFPKLAVRYKKIGGVDLRKLCKGLTKDKAKAEEFCNKIHSLQGEYAEKFVLAQFSDLCHSKGYIYEAGSALKAIGIEHPSPLTLAAVIDTLINQGLGGKWCAVEWLKEYYAEHRSVTEGRVLKDFLAWKMVAATKNEHNNPPSNGKARTQMFVDLMKGDGWNVPIPMCEKVVKWKML
jgi:hypothetical protein